MKQPLIVILGPTASGKTSLAIELAKRENGEIIGADSRQIFKEMDIATAKPSLEERSEIKHHLIDIIKPDQPYSLSQYKKDAEHWINQIAIKQKLPFLVGGTGLYISSIVENYQLPDAPPDHSKREELEKLTTEELYKMLREKDPETQVNPQNKRYIIRALETAGQPKTTAPSKYETIMIGIDWPREELYDRINQRIDQQIDEGLIEETENLLKKYPESLPAMSSLGYKELSGYLKGESSKEDAIELFKQHTRNYAKRQLTWFRRYKNIHWIPGDDLEKFIANPQTYLSL